MYVIGHKIVLFNEVDSTNSVAARWLEEGAVEEGTVIMAEHQTAGRGQRDNVWTSAKGQNLTFSIVLHPSFLQPEQQFYLSKAISLGVAAFIRRFTHNVTVKYPNDIYVNDRKIAGILIENTLRGTEIQHAIVGVGININQTVFGNEAPKATSLLLETGHKINLQQSLTEVCKYIDYRYNLLRNRKTGVIDKEYEQSLYRIGIWADYKTDNELFPGRIVGVSSDGKLMIESLDGGIRGFYFKEIVFL